MNVFSCTAAIDTTSGEQRISNPIEVLLVRQQVLSAAESLGFRHQDAEALATAVNGLARNVLEHAGGGWSEWDLAVGEGRTGIRVPFTDQGSGIRDVDAVLRDGVRSHAGVGVGLSDARRIVDDLRIQSVPGEGTRVEIVKWIQAGAKA